MTVFNIVAACLTLISQQPNMSEASTVQPPTITIAAELSRPDWLEEYFQDELTLAVRLFAMPDAIIEAIVCHGVFHHVARTMRRRRGLIPPINHACEEVQAYSLAIAILRSRDPSLTEFIAGQERNREFQRSRCTSYRELTPNA